MRPFIEWGEQYGWNSCVKYLILYKLISPEYPPSLTRIITPETIQEKMQAVPHLTDDEFARFQVLWCAPPEMMPSGQYVQCYRLSAPNNYSQSSSQEWNDSLARTLFEAVQEGNYYIGIKAHKDCAQNII